MVGNEFPDVRFRPVICGRVEMTWDDTVGRVASATGCQRRLAIAASVLRGALAGRASTTFLVGLRLESLVLGMGADLLAGSVVTFPTSTAGVPLVTGGVATGRAVARGKGSRGGGPVGSD
jgi:hypothetical protein